MDYYASIPNYAEISRYAKMPSIQLISLAARVSSRLDSPSYKPCDNYSDQHCCDDCGYLEILAELQHRGLL